VSRARLLPPHHKAEQLDEHTLAAMVPSSALASPGSVLLIRSRNTFRRFAISGCSKSNQCRSIHFFITDTILQ